MDDHFLSMMCANYSHYADTRLDPVRLKIWWHCTHLAKLSILITERELRGPRAASLQLMGVQFTNRNQLERALKKLHLNGDLVLVRHFTDATVNEEVKADEQHKVTRENKLQVERGAAGEAVIQAAIQTASTLSELGGYAVDKMKDLLGGRPKQADTVYVAGFTLSLVAGRLLEALSEQTGQRCYRDKKCLVPVEALQDVYNTAIRDSFTRVRVHLYLTSRGLVQSIPCPGLPNVTRMNDWARYPRPPIVDDLKLFRLCTDVVYIQSEMVRRNIDFNYKRLEYGNLCGAKERYKDPQQVARVTQMTEKELERRLEELLREVEMKDWKPYSVDGSIVDNELLHDMFCPGLSSCVDIKLIHTMFSSDSPYIHQLSNLYYLVKSVDISQSLGYEHCIEDIASSSVPPDNVQARAVNDLCNMKCTFKALIKLLEWIENVYLHEVIAPRDSFVARIRGRISSRSSGILNLTVAINNLSSILSKSSPDLNNLQLSSLVLGSPGLADLPVASKVHGMHSLSRTQRHVLKDPLHPQRYNPAYFIWHDYGNVALIIYVLANLALAHPNLVDKNLVSLGLATSGLANFFLANPELAHPSMAKFVESNPVVVNTCLAMHIIANLIMTYPSLTELEPASPESESDMLTNMFAG